MTWRLIILAALLTAARCSPDQVQAESKISEAPVKRSPISASGVYGAAPQGQYIVRQGDDAQELAPEYLALLQQYLEVQQRQQHQQQVQHQPQHQPQPQPQHVPQGRLGALVDHELTRLAERPLKHHQRIPLDVEQYHVETSPRRPVHQQPLYYQPVEDVPAPQPVHQQQLHHQQLQHQQLQHQQIHQAPAPVHQQVEAAPAPQLRYHQPVPVQYGYEDEHQIREQHQNPASIVRAQANAEAQALAFHKVAQASHYRHQEGALEQIRVANENYRKQSALEQIQRGEAVSEAGRQERIQPKDPESAYKARLKAQATALVAEQRRAQEAAEYKAHSDAILKLQAQQRAHLKAQEQAHHFALNFEKNQVAAQEHAQAIANAQALALYKARQQALAKAQDEAKHAAKAQHDARKADPDNAPVVQYLLPNSVPLPPPEVYLPKAAEALRAQAAAEKHLKKPKQQQLKAQHQLILEEIDPAILRRGPKPEEQPSPQQHYAYLVDAGYYRQEYRKPQAQRPVYAQGLEEIGPSRAQSHYQQYHQEIDADKLSLLGHQAP